MIDPLIMRACELSAGFDPHFNVGYLAKLLESAWALGFDLVPDPDARERLEKAQLYRAGQLQNVPASLETSGLQNANRSRG